MTVPKMRRVTRGRDGSATWPDTNSFGVECKGISGIVCCTVVTVHLASLLNLRSGRNLKLSRPLKRLGSRITKTTQSASAFKSIIVSGTPKTAINGHETIDLFRLSGIILKIGGQNS